MLCIVCCRETPMTSLVKKSTKVHIKLSRVVDVKIKSFYKLNDTCCSQKLQNDVKIRH